MKAIKALPASAAALLLGHRGAVDRGELDCVRQGTGEAQVRADHFALRIEPDLGLPARHQFDAAAQRRAMNDLSCHGLRNAKRFDQLAHVGAARRFARRRMRNSAGGKHRLFDLVGRREIRFRRAGAHDCVDANQAKNGPAVAGNDALFLVGIENISRHHEDIGLLSGRDFLAQRRHHRKNVFDLVAGLPFELWRQLLENFLRRAAAEDAQCGHGKPYSLNVSSVPGWNNSSTVSSRGDRPCE